MPSMLSSLPDELIVKVMKACEFKSLIALSKTCHRFNAIKNANDLIWKAQVWRMGSIPDDCPDLTAAIAAQYSTRPYFNDCTTWKRLFMKLYLTDQNWTLGRYKLTEIPVRDLDFDIWHIKLDYVKSTILLTNRHGGIRFIDLEGNTLYDLPTTTSRYPHCEFDGKYMAFMKDGGDRSNMEIWERVSDDGYEFEPYTTLEMPRRTSPRCYRLKDNHLLVACPFTYGHLDFYHLAFFDLKHPQRLAIFSAVGAPQYVDFDNELLYVAVEPAPDNVDHYQYSEPLVFLFRPLVKDFVSLETANAMLAAQWRELGMMSPARVAVELNGALLSKQAKYTSEDLLYREIFFTAVHVDVRSRLSQAHIVAVGEHEIWVNDARNALARLIRKYQVQVSEADISYENVRSRYSAFMNPPRSKIFQLRVEWNSYNLAVCNGRCAFAIECDNSDASPDQEYNLAIGTELDQQEGNVYMIPLPSSEKVRTVMMDDTMVLANAEDNSLMLFDFSADLENSSLPSNQAEKIKPWRQQNMWYSANYVQ